MSDFFKIVEEVFATWHYDYPRILYALMRSLKPEVAVEVGTYRGYAACYMAQALKENGNGHLYCIDDFSESIQDRFDSNHWHNNLYVCGVLDWATLINGKSSKVTWPDKVDFAYIDGWHGYLTVRVDFLTAAHRGAECICLDDTNSTLGPSFFVQHLREHYHDKWDVCEILRGCGLTICTRKQKKKPISFSQESMKNSGVVLTDFTIEEKRKYLEEVSKETGLDYNSFLFE